MNLVDVSCSVEKARRIAVAMISAFHQNEICWLYTFVYELIWDQLGKCMYSTYQMRIYQKSVFSECTHFE